SWAASRARLSSFRPRTTARAIPQRSRPCARGHLSSSSPSRKRSRPSTHLRSKENSGRGEQGQPHHHLIRVGPSLAPPLPPPARSLPHPHQSPNDSPAASRPASGSKKKAPSDPPVPLAGSPQARDPAPTPSRTHQRNQPPHFPT